MVSNACRRPVPVLQQVLFPGPYQDGIHLVYAGQLANRLAAVKRLQCNPIFAGRQVPPPFLDHRAAPPQAWQFALLHTFARGPVFGAKLRSRFCTWLELCRLLYQFSFVI